MDTAPVVMLGARSIAAPLAAELEARPIHATVATVTDRALTAFDHDGRMLCLVAIETGDGPCSIVVDRLPAPGWLATVRSGAPLVAHRHWLAMGDCGDASAVTAVIDLARVPCWRPRSFHQRRLRRVSRACLAVITARAQWPPASEQPRNGAAGSIAFGIARALEVGADRFDRATATGHGIPTTAERLLGLGPGLTPAGDDYLLGAMAALWLLGAAESRVLADLLARPRTRRLTSAPSTAWLSAASKGDFGVSWHRLADALEADHLTATQDAVASIAACGATSGQASLAGFGRTVAASWDRLEQNGACPDVPTRVPRSVRAEIVHHETLGSEAP